MEKITFGNNLPGYIAGPPDSRAAVILLQVAAAASSQQEWWGVTETVKEQGLRIAGEGYRVLIPDLYKGTVGVEVEEARHLMSHLDWPGALKETLKAAKYLRERGAQQVGVMGFCVGGALAAAAAQHPRLVDCAVVFYGLPDRQLCRPESVKAPLALHVGELDHMAWCGVEATTRFAEGARKGGAQVELHVYKNCGHSFLNEGEDSRQKRRASQAAFPDAAYPEPPPEQQAAAWRNVLDFLARHLQQP